MPKNRDYTGLVRTPPSMAWLIRQRAVLQGRLDKLNRQLETLPKEILLLQEQLNALDAVFPLHEIAVEPTKIKGTRAKKKALLPYGQMTKGVLKALKEAPQGQLYTTEIAAAIARQHGLTLNAKLYPQLNRAVLKRLEALHRQGYVERLHSTELGNNEVGSWRLIGIDQKAA